MQTKAIAHFLQPLTEKANWITRSFAGEAFLPYGIPWTILFLVSAAKQSRSHRATRHEIASARDARLAMTGQFGRNLG
jgi:hypothetical protein